MATTQFTATNTFSKGLIMDLHPLTVPNNCLTNALNASLLTFNGNEMQLQQDMGNGRVETAFLPEGYIPVGTCEFGDIIYIVSYNPLENKSQIGCFPSPERNITSDEITDIEQSLQSSDFQEFSDNSPNGVLKTTSVKKIIYGNKNMNPGDKYIIYEEDGSNNGSLANNSTNLSDYGNTSHVHDTWPKFIKIKVVSIEDSGKIVDLNASVKWYDNDYYLAQLSSSPGGSTPDLDSYRSLVSSAYSIFQSKVSGKLAILAELEKIDSFSCTYDVFTVKEDNKDGGIDTSYRIYFYTTWESSHNDINPTGFIFTKSAWTTEDGGGFCRVPYYDGNENVIKYTNKESEEDLPVEVAGSRENGWDVSCIFSYNLTYELGSSTDTYKHYIEEESYNAFIENIIDWYEEDMKYKAVELGDFTHEDLRTVTKINRILEYGTGEPAVGGNNQYQYVYNLDSYEYMGDGVYEYRTKSKSGALLNLNIISLNDDVVNNYFHKDIPSLINKNDYVLSTSTLVKISGDQSILMDNDLSGLVWNYEVAPVMPYGVLDFLAVSGSIDFSKIGSGIIDLTTWRYYNSGDVSTLTWGLDVYTEPNKGIAEVVFDFYDNQGLAASYHITDKTSYSGTFTDQIILNQRNSSYKMNNVDAYGHVYYHAGELDDSETESSDTVYLTTGNKPVRDKEGSYTLYPNSSNPNKYFDDSGTLYPNLLYLVRITVKYCSKDIVGEYNTDNQNDFVTFYRWYWTNGLFNESYYNIQDFDSLQPRLGLDFFATFDTRGDDNVNKLTPIQIDYYSGSYETDPEGSGVLIYSTLGARVYAINQNSNDDSKGNIKMYIEPGLSEGFNTFNLSETAIKDIDIELVNVILGHFSITKSIDSPSLIHTGGSIITNYDDSLQPIGDFNTNLKCSHDSNGWDRTGYAAYDYGVYNKRVSDNFLSLLSTSHQGYSPGSDTREEQTTGDSSTEIYSTGNAYLAYSDSFCLNLVNGNLVKNDTDFYYYDSEGNKIDDLSHYQEVSKTLSEARNDGIPLTLTGITFSKIFAAESSPDPDSVVLKSMIHNLYQPEINGPAIVGLHYYNGHLYFNEMVGWYMGEEGGHKTNVGTSSSQNITDNRWAISESDVIMNTQYDGDHEKWRVNYYEDEPQELLKGALTQPISAFMICAHGDNTNNTFSDVSWDNIHTAFSLGARYTGKKYIHEKSSEIPDKYPYKFQNQSGLWQIHSFIVRDVEQNLAIPFADYFAGTTSNYQTTSSPSTTPYTLGDMLGSIFAQLYVLTDETTDNYLLSNTTYLQDYTEYWNADIVVNIDTAGLEEGQIDKLITIQTQAFSTYKDCLIANAPCSEEEPEEASKFSSVNSTNVTIALYGIQRTISFQYGVPYDLGNLVYTYNQLSTTTNKIYLTTSDDNPSNYSGNQEVKSFTGNVTANTLYTWTGSGVTKLGSGSVIYIATEFLNKDNELCLNHGTGSNNIVNATGLSDLAKVLYYSDGSIEWRDLSQFSSWGSTYEIRYDGTGDNPYLKGLPNISIFKKYNPGK